MDVEDLVGIEEMVVSEIEIEMDSETEIQMVLEAVTETWMGSVEEIEIEMTETTGDDRDLRR